MIGDDLALTQVVKALTEEPVAVYPSTKKYSWLYLRPDLLSQGMTVENCVVGAESRALKGPASVGEEKTLNEV